MATAGDARSTHPQTMTAANDHPPESQSQSLAALNPQRLAALEQRLHQLAAVRWCPESIAREMIIH